MTCSRALFVRVFLFLGCVCRFSQAAIVCEGLLPVTCSNTCTQQTCLDYLRNGEIDECDPPKGDAACEESCGCKPGYKSQHALHFGAECVANDQCGCDAVGEDGAPADQEYYNVGYKFKKEGDLVCTCQSDHSFLCETDIKPDCPVVDNGCPSDCVVPGRGEGCPFCGYPSYCQ